jgi:DNA-binding beta-propeller fold protein YncE
LARGSLRLFALAVAALVAATMSAVSASTAERSASLIATVLPPTSVVSSADGSLVFVGLDRHFSDPGGIVAYHRDDTGAWNALGRVPLSDGARGIALTPDGTALVFTTRSGPGIVAVATLTARAQGAAIVVRDGDIPGSNQIVVSPDGRYAYFTNQRAASVGVARIARDTAGTSSLSIVAHVPIDRLPGGLAMSSDGALLYATSEIDNADAARVPGATDPRLGRTSCEINRAPHGVLSVIDVKRAIDDGSHAVVARIAAGCAPGRVALSPGDGIAWVSVRGDDRALAFATKKLLDDPEHALLAQFSTGPEPIGILATHDGAHVAVVSSDADAPARAPRHAGVAIFDTARALHDDATPARILAAGTRPREIREERDGTVWATDYAGRTVRTLELAPAL